MKAMVLLEDLKDRLNVASKVIDKRPILPILGNFLVEADIDKSALIITYSTFNLSITTWVDAKVEVPGKITLPSTTLVESVETFFATNVSIELDSKTETAQISCGSQIVRLRGLPADEFPPIKHYTPEYVGDEERGISFTIEANSLKDMIQQTSFAASNEAIRPVLSGINVRIKNNDITMASSDGYKLAVRKSTFTGDSIPETDIIVPVAPMVVLARIMQDDDYDIDISFSDKMNAITFSMATSILTSELLDGKFPDYKAIIPKSYATSAVVEREEFIRVCQLVKIFSKDNAYSTKLTLSVAKNVGIPSVIRIKGVSAERGDSEGLLDVKAEGEYAQVVFNVQYFIEGLRVMKSKDVVLQMNGAENPLVIKQKDQDNFVYLIMPMAK